MIKRNLIIQGKILLVVWAGIFIGAVYLISRFAAISFSDDVGQANRNIGEVIMTRLSVKAMESGSSFISYYADGREEADPFPLSLVTDEFTLKDFIKENEPKTAMAQEQTVLPEATSVNVPDDLVNEFLQENSSQKNTTKNTSKSIGFYNIINGNLSKEYIMTNGAVFGAGDVSEGLLTETLYSNINQNPNLNQLQIGFLEGDVFRSETDEKSTPDKEEKASETVSTNIAQDFTLEQLKDTGFLIRNFYIVDEDTRVLDSLFDAEVMLEKDMTIHQKNDAPQILIYHTHSQEAYADSRPDTEADTVVGIGTYLANILEDQYGYNVIHDKSQYDITKGFLDRNKAYNYARDGIEKILEENPTIEVVIDLHRDGGSKRITKINGEEVAQIMLFNGLCRDQDGPLTRLDNPNLEDNLAFSLQLQMKSIEMYPGLFFKNYLHAYRYNLHVRQKAILMELGTDYNSVQSAKNAMVPFAEILDSVLKGK
ncbi:MAG: putative rane protein [Herbinix sp.]|nr:putative rane protein [Herbinix sp.]